MDTYSVKSFRNDKFYSFVILIIALFSIWPTNGYTQYKKFVIHDEQRTAAIIYDTADYPTVIVAAKLLAHDIASITGHMPLLRHDLSGLKGDVIIVGSMDRSKFFQMHTIRTQIRTTSIEGKWETYLLRTIKKPAPGISNALVICGSDKRGTAYGVFDISQRVGMSPWYWWADVPPHHKAKLYLPPIDIVSDPPSVKYRGIFLNDEDWGLQPWAAKSFEPETGDIGPKTYAKIFELLLRLKANLIWPAMHPSTKAFYYYPENKRVADDYGIIVGSSHAEPMLRNNVGEWDEKELGHYDYSTNRDRVYSYWKERAEQSKRYENIYTIGMRGVHDSAMEGPSDIKDKITMVEKIFSDQREIIKNSGASDVTKIPQAFTAYKEVLELYNSGLKVPEDVTIVWPDDNYGYIHRLNNESEQKRKGGSGVYYHISYWGRPHDYLWLNSTHPMLIWEEMRKAYDTKSDRIWVVNVGDIKPLEYNVQLFLDMAYNMKPFESVDYVKVHHCKWFTDIFGPVTGASAADISWQYFQLAFERRPEFMGWSQTEPTTMTKFTEYNHFSFNDEAQRRLDRYSSLRKQADVGAKGIEEFRQDAYYELIYYPVRCAELINRKFLLNEKAQYYARQRRASATDFASAANQAYDSIVLETNYFNNKLACGKWRYMMSMQPRELPVFERPVTPKWGANQQGWGICMEDFKDENTEEGKYGSHLPVFYSWSTKKHFIDVFLVGSVNLKWSAVASDPWIRLSKTSGTLAADVKEERVWVSIDRNQLNGSRKGTIKFSAQGKQFSVPVTIVDSAPEGFSGFIEENGYVSMHAVNYTRVVNAIDFSWKIVDGLAYTGRAMMIEPTKRNLTDNFSAGPAKLEYDFYSFSKGAAIINIHCLPTHALNNLHQMRLSVSIDGGLPQVIDYRTFGRSESWKQGVLRNSAINTITVSIASPGKHTLTITPLDPSVVLDRITIDYGGLNPAYGVIPETRINPVGK